MKYKYSNCQ